MPHRLNERMDAGADVALFLVLSAEKCDFVRGFADPYQRKPEIRFPRAKLGMSIDERPPDEHVIVEPTIE